MALFQAYRRYAIILLAALAAGTIALHYTAAAALLPGGGLVDRIEFSPSRSADYSPDVVGRGGAPARNVTGAVVASTSGEPQVRVEQVDASGPFAPLKLNVEEGVPGD